MLSMPPAAGEVAAGDRQLTEVANSNRNRVTSADAYSILSQLASAGRCGDRARCLESVARIRSLSMESDRNRGRFASAGAACVLATAFRSFSAAAQAGGSTDIIKEILSALVLVFPIADEEFFVDIGSPESLESIASIIMAGGHPSGRLNAVLVLKEIVSFDGDVARAASRIDGLIEALVSLIRDPIFPQATKASLLAAFHLVASAEYWIAVKLVKMGLVDLILESLADSASGRRISEAALMALHRLCRCDPGREKAYENALTVPVLVVRMFGISSLATEHAVSSLLELCKNSKAGEEKGATEGFVVEALQAGAFLKLLILLQVDCSKIARKRATELLKFLNDYGEGLGCIDSKDFRGLRRPA